MGDQSTGPLDPAILAQEGRSLANDAYRVLKRPGAKAVEVRALTQRIAHLQDQIRGYPFVELACWLANVRHLVSAAPTARDRGRARRQTTCRMSH
jgi:hypothetical protein